MITIILSGEKFVRRVNLLPGVTCKPTGQKDEIMLEGNDIENVSRFMSFLSLFLCVLSSHLNLV